MKKLCIILCTVLCTVFLLFACSKKQDGKVLATIDDDKITNEEFSKALDKIPMNMKMVVATESGKKSYLDNMIVKNLILREAKKEKIDSDKDFQERLDEIKDQLLMETLLKKKLSMDGKLTDEDLKKALSMTGQATTPEAIANMKTMIKSAQAMSSTMKGSITERYETFQANPVVTKESFENTPDSAGKTGD